MRDNRERRYVYRRHIPDSLPRGIGCLAFLPGKYFMKLFMYLPLPPSYLLLIRATIHPGTHDWLQRYGRAVHMPLFQHLGFLAYSFDSACLSY